MFSLTLTPRASSTPGFGSSLHLTSPPPRRSALGMAAPQYSAQAAAVVSSRPVSPNGASWLISLRALEHEIDYQPGHVLAVEVTPQGHEKTLKGPYTVTRSDTDQRTVDVIYRVIVDPPASDSADHVESGPMRKTAAFKALREGDENVSFGGKFKVPILEGISKDAKHVVLVTSGAGVGPCIGFVEQCVAAWAAGDEIAAPSVSLFAGYRNVGDIICEDELDDLAARSGGRFSWSACLSSEGDASMQSGSAPAGHSIIAGRTTTAAPPAILKELASRGAALDQTHFHLVGNGEMVSEWKEALLTGASLAEERVTIEMYFGHTSPAKAGAVAAISEALSASKAPAGVAA